MDNILNQINKSNDIKNIDKKDYPVLAKEIRRFLVDSISKTGGHLASNLGAVELTMALHLTMDFPSDKLIWDVGHQSYVHKILTGRKEQFDTLRQIDGLSGFPKRSESDADSFDTGHSSTSLSAALGIATANIIKGDKSKVVAVIGDGALTGGMALEALNNISGLNSNIVIILNDNNMSISENVGGMSDYLSKLRVGEHYNDFKEGVERKLNKIPKVGKNIAKGVKKTKDHIKNLLIDRNFFDDLGITYIGPIDGHNVYNMVEIFEDAFKIDHPVLIHVKTKKGKGYKPAELNPSKFHGIDVFNKKTGETKEVSKKKTYTQVFSETIVDLAKSKKDIVAITAAMPDGTGLSRFKDNYPDRFFDVGIAEEHAVTFAAGLAVQGLKPFVSIYSSFYQRAYDQIVHDVCLQNLSVKFIVDRAGLVGQDGETHQGIFDMSFMSAIPNLTILSPSNEEDLVKSIEYAYYYEGPIAVRFPRGKSNIINSRLLKPIELGKSNILFEGKKIAIFAVGAMVEEASKAVEMFIENKQDNPTLVDARFIKPFDKDMINNLSNSHDYLLVVEEGIKAGGLGQQIQSYVTENSIDLKVEILAIDNMFVKQGKVSDLRARIGLDYNSIYEKVSEYIK